MMGTPRLRYCSTRVSSSACVMNSTMHMHTQKSAKTLANEVRTSARMTSQKGTGRKILSVTVLLSDLHAHNSSQY